MKTLVLGIGNTIMGDDGVGVHIVRDLAKKIHDKHIDVKDVSMDGLNLLELVLGYDKLIVIDAIMTFDVMRVGEVHKLKPEDIRNLASSDFNIVPHNFNLATTLALGEKLFVEQMPRDVIVFAVSAQEVTEITEKMTPEVAQAVPRVVDMVLKELALA